MNEYRITRHPITMVFAVLFALMSWTNEAHAAECTVELPAEDHDRLVELSDTAELGGIEDVRDRVGEIADIFASNDDPRGLFPVVYAPITARAVESVEQGVYGDEVWASAIIIEFARPYFDALNLHLTGGNPAPEWQHYYERATDCDGSWLRAAATGINTHLTVDLARTVALVDTPASYQADFDLYGEILVEVEPQIIDNLWNDYGVDAEDFFGGFFFGDFVDGAHGDGTLTSFVFQAVRGNAWRNGQLLRNWFTRGWGNHGIATTRAKFELALGSLEALGAI
ncbi:MAG: DUF5995 family protein [Myxococcota bacterium]